MKHQTIKSAKDLSDHLKYNAIDSSGNARQILCAITKQE